MKKILCFVTIICSMFLLTGCKGSNKIQGIWNAQDGLGKIGKIEITEDTLKIDNESYKFKQNAKGFENSTKYYGIIFDGENYTIIFPDKDDENIALFIRPNSKENLLAGDLIFAMNKKEVPNYNEYAEKYFSN